MLFRCKDQGIVTHNSNNLYFIFNQNFQALGKMQKHAPAMRDLRFAP